MPLDQFDGCIDLCASEQSADLATKLIEPTGTLIIVNRARYDLEPQSTMALDVNAIVVRELKVETVAECGDQMEAALAYLVTQCQDTAALAEIQRFVSSCVALANVHEVLEVTPTAQLEAAYLQVTCDLI
ncbi:TPA: hypothetical protein N0F65_011853 [Lagenidium giganteum]|uniref:Uncharacterized protein n=1 Tax=Lagenidium giganteum TaxID=4803 RepID=A0AAV2YKA6_9STRA|nr:TPA: hypothetical protein N0F65_011853 [Lagenidium giganteum]